MLPYSLLHHVVIQLWVILTVVPVLPPLQALKHKISSSIVGFVIGMAPLCTVVLSPIFGFFVSL